MVIELIEDGAKLLRALDQKKYPVDAMFWVDEPDDDRSRLIIASSDVIARSSGPGYQLIGSVLPKLDLSGLELSDIYLMEPDSRRFQSLLAFAKSSNKINAGTSWLRKADAVVYRWSPGALAGHLEPRVSAAELERVWKDYPASWFGKPVLLIAEDGGDFSLRIHPKHRPDADSDLPRVKCDFEKAIAAARPECTLTWDNPTRDRAVA